MAKKSKNGTNGKALPGEPLLPVQPPANEWLDIPTLETWLWDAACAVRGPVDAPKFKDDILPLVFYKRLSDVFDDELARITADPFDGDAEMARESIDADHAAALHENRKPIVRCYIPGKYDWYAIRNPSRQRQARRVHHGCAAQGRQTQSRLDRTGKREGSSSHRHFDYMLSVGLDLPIRQQTDYFPQRPGLAEKQYLTRR